MSLESKTLITPTVVPMSGENYKQYEAAVGRWIALRDSCSSNRVNEREIDTCLNIHHSLLTCAEEARYPVALTIKELLEETARHPGQSWQRTWQDSLLARLSNASYINYQSIVLLYAILFSLAQDQKTLANLLLKQYQSTPSSTRPFAQRFIATLSKDLRNLRNLRYVGRWWNWSDLRNLRNLFELWKSWELRNLFDLRYLSELSKSMYLSNLIILSHSSNLSDLRYLSDLSNLSDLRGDLLVPAVAEQAKKDMLVATAGTRVDLLFILLGRVLQIQQANEQDPAVEQEVQGIACFVIDDILLKNANQAEVVDAALDIIRALPRRSGSEVAFMQRLAEENGANPGVQQACADAICNTRSKEADVRKALEACAQSRVKAIREAGKEALAGG